MTVSIMLFLCLLLLYCCETIAFCTLFFSNCVQTVLCTAAYANIAKFPTNLLNDGVTQMRSSQVAFVLVHAVLPSPQHSLRRGWLSLLCMMSMIGTCRPVNCSPTASLTYEPSRFVFYHVFVLFILCLPKPLASLVLIAK